MQQRGIDPITLRAMTEHSSEEMTDHYCEVTITEKHQAAAAAMAQVLKMIWGEPGEITGDQGTENENARHA
jgi:hypothetical protein